MSAIARVYWRCIKRGTRRFSALSAKLQEEVRALAEAEAAAGELTREQADELLAG